MRTTPSPDARAVVKAVASLTTQVGRIADALTTPVVEHVDGESTTPSNRVPCPYCVAPTMIASTLITDHIARLHNVGLATYRPYPAADDDGATMPLDDAVYCPLCPDAPHLLNPADATNHFRAQHPEQRLNTSGAWQLLVPDDGATTPATTCSAQHLRFDDGRLCIRAAQHDSDHIDERGFHWSETVAVYPRADSTVRVAHWHPASEQLAEERQELAGMVSEFIDAQQRQARAADEHERCITHFHGACDGTTRDCAFPSPGTGRRRSLRVLLNRLNNGVALTSDEVQLLTRHVATEITEHNTARAVAAGNKRHVQVMYAELEAANEAGRRALEAGEEMAHERDAADRIRAEVQRDRDQHAAVLTEVLGRFTAALVNGKHAFYQAQEPVPVEEFERWRATVAPTAERPWWEQVALYEKEAVEATKHVLELKATIERVRHLVTGAAQTTSAGLSDHDIGRFDMAVAILAALDGTEQPTT